MMHSDDEIYTDYTNNTDVNANIDMEMDSVSTFYYDQRQVYDEWIKEQKKNKLKCCNGGLICVMVLLIGLLCVTITIGAIIAFFIVVF